MPNWFSYISVLCAAAIPFHLAVNEAVGQEKTSVQSATQLKVVNATAENVDIQVSNALGNSTHFLFQSGSGHFGPVDLYQGIGDRVVSVRRIKAGGTVVLPSKVLALSKFDPADCTGPLLVLTFVSGTAGHEIIYTVSRSSSELGDPLMVKGKQQNASELSAKQKKSIKGILKTPALKAGAS